MLVRLLGKEAEAKAGTWTTPLTDVDAWAQPYVGYAYTHGLTTGISATVFGGNQSVTAAQYLTFVLRALGYVSGEDFQWDKAWELTDELGITHGEYGPASTNGFLRADVALVSKAAMSATPKGSDTPLLDLLINEGVVTEQAAIVSGLRLDAYALFAQQLLDAADAETHHIPLEEKSFSDQATEPLLGKSDLYIAYLSVDDINDPQAQIQMLSLALRQYISACMDGNYNNHSPAYTKHTGFGLDSAILLTDEKGGIVGFGFYDADGPEEVVLYTCRVDSRDFVDSAVVELNASIDALPRVDCEMTYTGGIFTLSFSEIPEGTVKIINSGSGLFYNDPPTETELRQGLENFFKQHIGNTRIGDPVQNPYCYDNLWPNDHGYAYAVLVFVDDTGFPLGYACCVLKV